MIARLLSAYREHQARARLAQLVKQTRSSYEIIDYRKRRAAAMKGRALKREKSLG